ncbi:MAG: response regulator transcription factor [Anaerolineales bacterium]|nr:MAG: response regulator transcription factor [Anaerolineales bacterium]
MPRILIADDHAIVRTGLRTLLQTEPTLELVGEAAGGYEAIEQVAATSPDILLLDLSMPDLDGIAVTKALKPAYPNLRILILTIHEDEALVREAIKAGASGYVLKRAAESELVTAIGVLMRGDMYVDHSLLRPLVYDNVDASGTSREPVEALTPREKDVLGLIVLGYTNRQIGEELAISVRTVEGHRANLSEKIGSHSRADLVRYAREHGLIDEI